MLQLYYGAGVELRLHLGSRGTRSPQFDLETFIINKVEDVSICHYDHAYLKDTVVIYRLPFSLKMEDLDITVSVIPVTGSTQLGLKVGKINTSEDIYDFKVIAQLVEKSTLS